MNRITPISQITFFTVTSWIAVVIITSLSFITTVSAATFPFTESFEDKKAQGGEDKYVCDKEQLLAEIATVQAGDRVFLCDGEWKDLKLTVNTSGTSTSPILIIAENPGEVIISGNSYIELKGSYIHVRGFRWENGGNPAPMRASIQTQSGSRNCQISEMLFEESTLTPFDNWIFNIALRGIHHEVFNSAFRGKYGRGAQLKVLEGGVQLNHNLHHLWFRRKLLLNANGVDINGGESLQIGAGDGRELPADDVNAHHLFFTKANGEGKKHGEVISLKGSRLILSDIVMLESEGMVSLRLGNENQISRLFIDANEKPNAAGIIFWGDRHRVEDVFVTGMSARWKGGLLFRSAEKAHDPSDNIIINHVTIMDSPDSISIGTSGKNSLPSGLMFNSIVAVAKTPQDRVLFVNEAVNAFRFTDSFLYGESNVPSPSGVKNVDPLLIPMDDGLYIPDENGPAKGQGSRMTSLPVYENETGPLTYRWNENIPLLPND